MIRGTRLTRERRERVVVGLFAGLGGFSAAFEDSDEWRAVTVDIEQEFEPLIRGDVGRMWPSDLGVQPDVVLASPPCTLFSFAGNHEHWDLENHVPVTPEARDAVALVHHTLGVIKGLNPRFWFVENPVGRMQWFIDEEPRRVTYCRYGESYMKPTHLWGEHPTSMTYKSYPRGGDCHESNTAFDGTEATRALPDDRAERALVPYELSREIHDACERELDSGPETRQATIGDVAALNRGESA